MSTNESLEENNMHLCNSIVRRINSLEPLFARDSDPNVCRLNHADIVRSISDGKCHGTETILHQIHNECFLERRHSTTDYTVAQGSETKQNGFVLFISECLPVEVSD